MKFVQKEVYKIQREVSNPNFDQIMALLSRQLTPSRTFSLHNTTILVERLVSRSIMHTSDIL